MKQTSISKLSEVYNALRDPENASITNQQAAEMIQQVIRAEAMTPAKAGKFNLYNYVESSEIRPCMCGVFHDGGNKVACDSHILVAIKEDYPAEYEGAVLLKDGSYVEIEEVKWDKERKHCETIKHRTGYVDQEGRNRTIYPKWRDIIPDIKRGGGIPHTSSTARSSTRGLTRSGRNTRPRPARVSSGVQTGCARLVLAGSRLSGSPSSSRQWMPWARMRFTLTRMGAVQRSCRATRVCAFSCRS